MGEKRRPYIRLLFAGYVHPHYTYHTASTWSDVIVRRGTPFNGLYGVAPPERGTFFRLRLYEREGISLDDENKSVGKSVIYLRSVKRRKGLNTDKIKLLRYKRMKRKQN